jgi:hypothetical protein
MDHLPETMMTRDRAALALSERGYPVSKLSLSTLASRGGGPQDRHFGLRVLYRRSDLMAWAEGRCTEPRGNTSEADRA